MMFAALFGVLIGLILIGVWISLFVSDRTPGSEHNLRETVLQWSAELATAIMLVAGGFGLLTESAWGRPLFLLSVGMLLLTVISTLVFYTRRRGQLQNQQTANSLFEVLSSES